MEQCQVTSITIDVRDGLSSSTAIKGPAKVASTVNLTLSGEQTIDGVAIVTDDRVLVKNQTTASENGIYVADTGPWRRAKDFNKTRDVKTGTMVNVYSGTAGAGQWQVTTADPITIGTTNIAFAQLVMPFDADLAALALIGTAVAGDLIYATGAGAWGRLATGGALKGLRLNAAGTAPEWANLMPGIDVNGFAGANETAKIAAMYVAAPTQPYMYRADSHFGIIRDTAPLNYQGTRAAFVVQQRDTAAGTTNELIPGVVFQFTSTGNGVVTAGSDLSQTIWQGLFSTMAKTGDGSAHPFTAIGSLGAYGAGLYNELGGFVGELTNIGSLHGTMSGVELLLKDSADAGANDFDTTMNAVIGRVARYNAGSRKSRNFFASSEGSVALDAILGVNTQGSALWVDGINLVGASFSSGQAVVMPNNTAVAARNAAGNANINLLFLDASDNTWVAAGGKTKAVFIGNSDFEKQFSVLATDDAVNYFEVSGAITSGAPLHWVVGSDTNIGAGYGTKGTGVHSFYTGGVSFYKQLEISHIASSVNHVRISGSIAANALGPIFQAAGSDTNIPLSIASKGSGSVFLLSNAGTVHDFRGVANGVNYLGETNAATTGTPLLFSAGADTNVGFALATKGTGVYSFFTNSASKQLEISHVASAVNWATISGGATGAGPVIGIGGTDADRSLIIQGKGTGGVVLRDGASAAKLTLSTTGISFFGSTVVAQRTGWGVPTGTFTRTTYVTSTVTLPQLAERVAALVQDLHTTAGYGLLTA